MGFTDGEWSTNGRFVWALFNINVNVAVALAVQYRNGERMRLGRMKVASSGRSFRNDLLQYRAPSNGVGWNLESNFLVTTMV